MAWENNFFYLLFLNAVTGNIAFLLSKILIQIAKRYGDARLIYNLLRGVIVFFAVPFSYIYVAVKSFGEVNGKMFSYDGNAYTADLFHKIFLVWLIITSAIAIFYIIRFVRYIRLRNFNIPFFDDQLQDLISSFYPDRRLKRIEMYTNMMCPTPCIMGVLKPVLVLPEVPFSREERMVMIAHEATHVMHRDTLWKTIGRVIVIVCWWNPFLYWYMKDLEEWTETYCDDTVCRLILGGDWQRYSNALVSSVTKSKAYSTMRQSMLAMFCDKQTLFRRVKRLSKLNMGKRKTVVSIVLSMIFILGSSTTAIAAGELTSEKGEEVYVETMETESATADQVAVNLDVVDNETVFSMTLEELEAEGYEIVDMESENGVATYGTQKFFDWDIEAASIAASGKFLKKKDSTLTVCCYVTFPSGQEGSARVGIIKPDGTFRFVMCENDSNVSLTYTVESLGYYKVAVQNIRNFEINASGYYVR